MNRRIVLVLILILSAACLYAGDVAEYVNLGFSEDSEYFMFGQYGIEYGSSNPYAEIYTVKVTENKFAENGVFKKVYNKSIQPGQNGSGALFNLLSEKHEGVKNFDVDHLNKGRIVYILINGAEPKEKLEFRDFKNNGRYKVELIQNRYGTDEKPSASFHIDLTATDKTNTVSTYTVGLPGYQRDDVIKYRIKQVMFAPDEKSLVFVVEKEMLDGTGPSIRYMVETVDLN